MGSFRAVELDFRFFSRNAKTFFQPSTACSAGMPPIIIEKAMTGAVIAVKLIVLAMLLELRLVLVHLFRRRRFVVVAEKADHRAGKIFGKINAERRVRVWFLLFHNHTTAPAFD